MKVYLAYFFLMTLCTATWAVYTDSIYIFLIWGARNSLICTTDLLINLFKGNNRSQLWFSIPVTTVLATVATGSELWVYTGELEKLLQWDCIAYAMFTVPILVLTAFVFVKETNLKFNMMTKLVENHVLMMPTPVWLILKPPPSFSLIFH